MSNQDRQASGSDNLPAVRLDETGRPIDDLSAPSRPVPQRDQDHGEYSSDSGRREYRLNDGRLAVSAPNDLSTDAVTLSVEDRPLYELLSRVLADVHLPTLFPAVLAKHSTDLLDARETLRDLDRGSVTVGDRAYGMSYTLRAAEAIEDHRDRDPLRLVAVGCSGSKHHDDGLLRARERYRGSYWSCKEDYMATVGADGRIISAEYAVLHPEEPIPDYERTPEDLEGVPVQSDARLPSGKPVETLLDQWAVRVQQELQQWVTLAAGGIDPRDVELEILLGQRYRSRLEKRGVFEALRGPAELSISFPFQEEPAAAGGNGNQMGWMTDQVAAVTAGEADE